MRKGLSAAILLGIFVLSASSARAQDQINPYTYNGPNREEKLLSGARREGQVVFYSGMIENQALRPLAQAFQKKYPFVKLTYWRADSEAIVAKISAEVRGRRHIGDVIEGTGIGEEAIKAGLTQPFTTPLLNQIPTAYRDPDRLWVPTRLSYFGTAYNTRLTRPDQVPKSYMDLLEPKWKGKMAWSYGPAVGAALFITNLRMAWGEQKAMEFLKKLAAQNVINYGATARALVDRVISGEFQIGLNIYAHHPLISQAKGAPVNTVLMDPVPAAAGTALIPKGAPHPYAAMLLIDFLLSKDGQSILAKSKYFPVRMDVPPLPNLKRIVPKENGYHENFISPQALSKYTDSSNKIARELFR